MDKRLVWLAMGTFAIGVEGFVISSLLPAIAGETGVSITEAGYLVLAYALAYAVGAPVLATLTGAIDRRRTLVSAALVFSAGALLAGFAGSYWVLLAARLLMAFCAGLYFATAQATAIAIAPPEQRARAIAIVVGGTTLAVALGAPLGALIAGLAGWRGAYFAVAAIGIVAAVAIRLLLPAGLRGEKRTLRERLAVLSVPGVRPALLTTLLFMTGPFVAFIYIAPLARSIGLGTEVLPVILLAFGVGAAIGNYVGGQSSDRFGATQTVRVSIVVTAALLALLSLIPLLPDGLAQPAFIAIMIPWGIAGWAFLPAQVSRLVSLTGPAAALVISLNGSALYLGTALGAVVGGQVLAQASVYELGWIAAVFPVAALWVLVASTSERVVVARQG